MYQGKIIEHIDQGRFVCTLCLQDRGSRLHVLTLTNREVNLSPKRAVLVSASTLDVSKPRQALLERLKRTDDARNRLKTQVDVAGLWELIRGEEELFSHEYLAQLVFGEGVSDDHVSALVRALFENQLYFKLKDGHFLPNSEERVEQILHQREEAALREKKLQEGSAWLRAVLAGEKAEAPPSAPELIEWLKQLALYGEDAPQVKAGRELLARSGIAAITEARKILVRLGVWEEDENLDLIRFKVPTGFTDAAKREAENLLGFTVPTQGREDLRDLPVFTIDGPETLDFDDAISCVEQAGELHVGVHIVDVAEMIPPESRLDREAAERASSLYLPRRQISMLPPELAHDVLSLRQGHDRAAISLLARFDRQGHLLGYRFVPSLVRVERQWTYAEVNDALADSAQFQSLHRLSRQLQEQRLAQNALALSMPELHVEVTEDGDIILSLLPQDSPSRMIIAELMILYNWLAAEFCHENQVPILYRTQPEPSERLERTDEEELLFVFQQRRKLSPLQIDTQPGLHSSLGLQAYTHLSSPIRRYLDLVSQRQLRGHLLGTGHVYSPEQLEEIRMKVEPVLRELARIKRNRLRYWVLKYLSRHRDKVYQAMVLHEMRNKVRVVLRDFLMLSDLRRPEGAELRPGQNILVRVKRANPWADDLELEMAG